MDKIEINIPAGASEVTLKTAGKYCDKDIRVTSHFRTVTGSFTPEADTNILSLAIPAGAKAVEIIAQTAPEKPDGAYAVHYAYGVQFIGDNASYSTGNAFTVDYYIGSKFVRGFYAWDTTNGLSVTMDSVILFRSGITYNYTAYYWDE